MTFVQHSTTQAFSQMAPDFPDDDPWERQEDGCAEETHRREKAAASKPRRERTLKPLEYTTFGVTGPQLDANDFVEGLITAGTMSVVYGESNSGKTFFASDLALRVAAGMAWRDREVEAGAVLYLALEGGFGISNRIAAFRKEHDLDGEDVPFAVVTVAINLLDPDQSPQPIVDTVEAIQRQFGIPLRLVVIDTLSRAMAGGNENAPEDMTRLVSTGDKIREQTKAHLMWIHHSGKDAARGARGHSSLRAATDTEIEITANGHPRSARVTKQRDLECSGEFAFTLKVVELGQNTRGKVVTSCVVEHGDGQEPGVRRSALPRGHNKRALEILADLVATSGQSGEGAPAGAISVPEKWWRERFYERALPGAEQDTKKRAFRRAADFLVEHHHVGMGNGRVWVA